jgi:GxxExxY protein
MKPVSSDLARQVIGCAIRIHRTLGPGLYEGVYKACLGLEFSAVGLRYLAEVPLPIVYRDLEIRDAYRADFLIEDELLLEAKCVERLSAVHEAQTLTYMRLSNATQALLVNFNVPLLKDGLKSFLNTRAVGVGGARREGREDRKVAEVDH